VGTPYTLFFGRQLYSTFMEAYALVDNSVRRKMDEMLKTWKEPVPGSIDTRPVFPPDVTRPIENALIKARTSAVQAHQEHLRTQQQYMTRGRPGTSATPYRQTPTPPTTYRQQVPPTVPSTYAQTGSPGYTSNPPPGYPNTNTNAGYPQNSSTYPPNPAAGYSSGYPPPQQYPPSTTTQAYPDQAVNGYSNGYQQYGQQYSQQPAQQPHGLPPVSTPSDCLRCSTNAV
jgi:pre-mRNA cleavage complex 2 protein Pcf11